MHYNDDLINGKASGRAVNVFGRLIAAKVAEAEKTKRLVLAAVVFLWILAILVLVFAPDGRETLSIFASSVLVILSLGVIGVRRFYFKGAGIEVSANEDPSGGAKGEADSE